MIFDTNYTRISSEELKKWMDEGREFTLLDVLPEAVFSARRIPGAKSACVFEVAFPEHVAAAGIKPEDDAPVVVYGVEGETKDGDMAAKKLIRMGFPKVYLLQGGFADWKRLDLPVEGDGDEPTDHKALPPEGSYTVVPEESVIEWTGRNANGKHSGTLAVSEGTVRIVDGKVGGEFGMRLDSMKNTDLDDPSLAQALVNHLLSDDFFFAERYPEVGFKVEQAEFLNTATPGAVNYHVLGELFLRGRIEKLAFPLTVQPIDGGIAAEAHFDMDRTRWGAIYGSSKFFKHLGMHLVGDTVSIQLRIVAR